MVKVSKVGAHATDTWLVGRFGATIGAGTNAADMPADFWQVVTAINYCRC